MTLLANFVETSGQEREGWSVEGTLSQAVSTTRMRRSPYIGLQKTHLHHVTIAAGMNLVRIGDHLQSQTCGNPSCRSHPQSAFARLQPLYEAC
jgi:hypothetical protein